MRSSNLAGLCAVGVARPRMNYLEADQRTLLTLIFDSLLLPLRFPFSFSHSCSQVGVMPCQFEHGFEWSGLGRIVAPPVTNCSRNDWSSLSSMFMRALSLRCKVGASYGWFVDDSVSCLKRAITRGLKDSVASEIRSAISRSSFRILTILVTFLVAWK